MERRTLLRRIAASSVTAVGAGAASGSAAASGSGAASEGVAVDETATARSPATTANHTISELYFDSTSSLLNAESKPLTSEEHVAVRTKSSATVSDEDGAGDAVEYGDADPVLVAVDNAPGGSSGDSSGDTTAAGTVVGFGTMLVTNDDDFAYGNDEFVLNVWDATADGGTILWDEGHEQYYVADKFSTFAGYAEDNGYTVEATTDLTADLDDASGVVITSPTAEFSEEELSALSSFVADGGALYLHDQSDYRNFDETDNLNALAAHLDLAFRFNDDQVVDETNNAGAFYQPVTDQFNTGFDFFASREGIASGPEFSFDEEYTATITEVDDGDTFTVQFDDGSTEEVRVLGVDTPEVPAASDAENPYEWEGLGDQASMPEQDGEYPYLSSWGDEASAFAKDELSDATVTLTFDENEGIEDPFGRILAYTHYDADGSGSRDTLWAQKVVSEGYARVYDSGLARHDELIQTELAAREEGRGVWAESDPTESTTIRNGAVEQLFFPQPVSVGTFGGELPDEQVPVSASSSASESEAPLVAVDRESRVALVGAPLVADDYEGDEYPGDPSAYGNMAFLTNLLDALGDREGDVLWDGGHGQFDSDAGISMQGATFYQRYLEGVDLGIEQINSYGTLLDRGRALLVTPPTSEFTNEEISAIKSFRDAGGSVVLFGTAKNSDATSALNGLAASLGTDLTFDTTGLTDAESNRGGNEELLVTTNFDTEFGLFDGFEIGNASLPATATATPSPTASPTDSPETTADQPATATDAATVTDAETAASGPGFGAVTGAVSVLGGGLYALRNRLAADEE